MLPDRGRDVEVKREQPSPFVLVFHSNRVKDVGFIPVSGVSLSAIHAIIVLLQ